MRLNPLGWSMGAVNLVVRQICGLHLQIDPTSSLGFVFFYCDTIAAWIYLFIHELHCLVEK